MAPDLHSTWYFFPALWEPGRSYLHPNTQSWCLCKCSHEEDTSSMGRSQSLRALLLPPGKATSLCGYHPCPQTQHGWQVMSEVQSVFCHWVHQREKREMPNLGFLLGLSEQVPMCATGGCRLNDSTVHTSLFWSATDKKTCVISLLELQHHGLLLLLVKEILCIYFDYKYSCPRNCFLMEYFRM